MRWSWRARRTRWGGRGAAGSRQGQGQGQEHSAAAWRAERAARPARAWLTKIACNPCPNGPQPCPAVPHPSAPLGAGEEHPQPERPLHRPLPHSRRQVRAHRQGKGRGWCFLAPGLVGQLLPLGRGHILIRTPPGWPRLCAVLQRWVAAWQQQAAARAAEPAASSPPQRCTSCPCCAAGR